MMKLIKKILVLSLFLILTLNVIPLSDFATVYAADIGGHISNTGGKGTKSSSGGYNYWGNNLIKITVMSSTGGKYVGQACSGHFQNPSYNSKYGQTAYNCLLSCNVPAEKINAYIAKRGIKDVGGVWHTKSGALINTIDITNIMDPNSATTIEVTEQNTQGDSYDTKIIDDTVWVLVKVDASVEGANINDSINYNGQSTETDDSTTLYSWPTNNAAVIYNGRGRSYDGAWYRPNSVYQYAEYTATWIQVRKCHFHHHYEYRVKVGESLWHDSKGWHSSPIYEDRVDDYDHSTFYETVTSTTATSSISYDADIHYPEYIEMNPLDLTTNTNYTGSLIKNKNYAEYNEPSGHSGKVDATVSSKSGLNNGEMLSLLAYNNPVEFTINFGNSWYGVPDSYHLDGNVGVNGWKSDGYQYVVAVSMFYGADYLQNNRSLKLNSITSVDGSATKDYTTTLNKKISSGTSGSKTFYVRSIKANPEGDYYMLGEDGNNYWTDVVEMRRCNLKGVDWKLHVDAAPSGINASIIRSNYTKYLIYSYFEQPVLYGQYNVYNTEGR